MMIPNDLHYYYPPAAYFLLGAVIVFALFVYLYGARQITLSQFAPYDLLRKIVVPRSRYNFWAKAVAFTLAWIGAVLALMQPRGNGHYPLETSLEVVQAMRGEEKEAVVQRKAHDVIFLVDASASMGVADTRAGETRLDYAKEIVDETVRRLKGESAALYAFTSDTTKLSPPTMDYLFVRLMLRQININEGDLAGTNVVEAIADMREEYFSVLSPKLKTLVVLTDGGDTQLEGLKGTERENHIKAILSLFGKAEENNLRVFTIGMGTEQGKRIPNISYQGQPVTSSLDEDLLKKLSQTGRGKYYFANHQTAVDIAEDLVTTMGEEKPLLEEYKIRARAAATRGEEDLVYDLYFQYPLGIAIVLLAFALFFPDSRMRKDKPSPKRAGDGKN